jgi:Lar family restriction alleviation protein
MTIDAEKRELLPCPFCGGEAVTNYIRDGRRAACTKCGAAAGSQFHGPLDRPDAESRAIIAWNTRALSNTDQKE